jgi:hypothetical protein
MKNPILSGAMVLVAMCVASPTKAAEQAEIDYGACPKTYVEKAKIEFQGSFLTGYAGEPMIWPPQKFSYKGGLFGSGDLVAGYLVLVRVNQTRGNPNFMGTQTWGLLFKNEEIVSKLQPARLQAMTLPIDVGPIPRDERDWKIGHSQEKGNLSLSEWVVPGETVKAWTELITVEMYANPPAHITLDQYLSVRTEMVRKQCANATGQVISKGPLEAIVERTLLSCAPLRDEYHIAKVLLAPRAMTNVVYARTTPFDSETRAKWLEIVTKTRMMGDC